LYTLEARNLLTDRVTELTGARLTTSFGRIGRVNRDLPPGWVEKLTKTLNKVEDLAAEVDALLTRNRIFTDRTRGTGVITRAIVAEPTPPPPAGAPEGIAAMVVDAGAADLAPPVREQETEVDAGSQAVAAIEAAVDAGDELVSDPVVTIAQTIERPAGAWLQAKIRNRGRVTMGTIDAPASGHVIWITPTEREVKKAPSSASSPPAEGEST